jgi:L-lactate dehydrogenase complex protein LldE
VLEQTEEVEKIRAKTLDLSEFLLDVLQIKSLPAKYPHRVGLHQSCHGLRGLHLGTSSERAIKAASKLHELLAMVEGLTLVELERKDECCGFGGTFSIKEPDISVKMGKDRIRDHVSKDAEIITSGDMSCLMHLEGIITRNKIPVKVRHLAEILNAEES